MLKSKLTLLLFLLLISIVRAQIIPTFMYQAQLTDNNGSLLVSQSIDCKIELIQDGNSSNPVYQEYQELTTSLTGMLELQVGNGTYASGSISDINWQSGAVSIRISIDIQGWEWISSF